MVKNDEVQLQQEFISAWSKVFYDAPPLGYELRDRFTDKWTSFHALPLSKRYADTDDERKIILSRANELASECFNQNDAVWLITAKWDAKNELARMEHMLHVLTWHDGVEEDGFQNVIEFWATKTLWVEGSLDRYFTGVAEEEYDLVMFDSAKRLAFAPYDGGFDIIAFDPQFLENMEDRYSHWMSKRTDKR